MSAIDEAVKIATRPDGTFDCDVYWAEVKARDPEGVARALAFCKRMAEAEEKAAAGLGPPVPSLAKLMTPR